MIVLSENQWKRIVSIVYDYDFRGEQVECRPDYNGRGMADRQCVAIVGPANAGVMFAATIAEDLVASVGDCCDEPGHQHEPSTDDLVEQLYTVSERMLIDSMGRSSVFYFPNVVVSGHERRPA